MDDISKNSAFRALDEADQRLMEIHWLTSEGSKLSRQVKELRILLRRLFEAIKSEGSDAQQ